MHSYYNKNRKAIQYCHSEHIFDCLGVPESVPQAYEHRMDHYRQPFPYLHWNPDNIEPPESLPEIRKEFMDLKEKKASELKASEEDKILRILGLWRRSVME